MPDLPTGTITLLFTDMEGSTRLLQQVGERYADVLADCRHLLRAAFAQYHGHEVDTQAVSFLPLKPCSRVWSRASRSCREEHAICQSGSRRLNVAHAA